MPGPDRAEPDPRIVMLRRMIDGIEDGTMRRDTVLDLVEATGLEGMFQTIRSSHRPRPPPAIAAPSRPDFHPAPKPPSEAP